MSKSDRQVGLVERLSDSLSPASKGKTILEGGERVSSFRGLAPNKASVVPTSDPSKSLIMLSDRAKEHHLGAISVFCAPIWFSYERF